jgi:hypothetical protein
MAKLGPLPARRKTASCLCERRVRARARALPVGDESEAVPATAVLSVRCGRSGCVGTDRRRRLLPGAVREAIDRVISDRPCGCRPRTCSTSRTGSPGDALHSASTGGRALAICQLWRDIAAWLWSAWRLGCHPGTRTGEGRAQVFGREVGVIERARGVGEELVDERDAHWVGFVDLL